MWGGKGIKADSGALGSLKGKWPFTEKGKTSGGAGDFPIRGSFLRGLGGRWDMKNSALDMLNLRCLLHI